jgi:uncharacterized protein
VIIADTGFFLALASKSDRHHARATDAIRGLKEPLVTTWPVMTETCHLLASRVGHTSLMAFMSSAERGAFQLFALEARHLSTVVVLMEKYRDLPMDLADASLVVLADELGSGRIFSTDTRDFKAYRWKSRRPFTNLLLRT